MLIYNFIIRKISFHHGIHYTGNLWLKIAPDERTVDNLMLFIWVMVRKSNICMSSFFEFVFPGSLSTYCSHAWFNKCNFAFYSGEPTVAVICQWIISVAPCFINNAIKKILPTTNNIACFQVVESVRLSRNAMTLNIQHTLTGNVTTSVAEGIWLPSSHSVLSVAVKPTRNAITGPDISERQVVVRETNKGRLGQDPFEEYCARGMYQGQGQVITSQRYCGM